MKESGKIIRGMVKVFFIIQMEKSMMGSGRMMLKLVKVKKLFKN